MDNPCPVVYEIPVGGSSRKAADTDPSLPFDAVDVYELLRDIRDPEHPYTLEQLKVIDEKSITVEMNEHMRVPIVHVQFCPTVPHCSLASMIGLCIRTRLQECIADEYKLNITVVPGKHATEDDINKQVNDKERVQAAMENPFLCKTVHGLCGD